MSTSRYEGTLETTKYNMQIYHQVSILVINITFMDMINNDE